VDHALELLHSEEVSANAAVIGVVTDQHKGRVVMKSRLGTTRIIDMLSGEQLPRIC
jgi:hydrogenase expression/formation protein HypE